MFPQGVQRIGRFIEPLSRPEGDGSRLDEVVADGITNQIGERIQPEFSQNARAMRLCCPDADTKRFGNFLVAFSFGQELDDLALSRTQTLAGFGLLASASCSAIDDV